MYHNQAEFTLNFWRYMNSRESNNRLKKGKVKLEEIKPKNLFILKFSLFV
jgi:hypothetical protein